MYQFHACVQTYTCIQIYIFTKIYNAIRELTLVVASRRIDVVLTLTSVILENRVI